MDDQPEPVKRRGRPPGAKDKAPRARREDVLVPCPVRVTPEAAEAAREMGGAELSALILRSARSRRSA